MEGAEKEGGLYYNPTLITSVTWKATEKKNGAT